LLSLTTVSAFAAEVDPGLTESERAELYQDLCKGILDGKTEIDVSKYQIPVAAAESIVMAFIWDNPTYSFCIDGSAYGSYQDTIQKIMFQYDDLFTIQTRHAAITSEINKIIAMVDKNWTDVQKVLWINDYICDVYTYDLLTEHHHLDEFISTGKGICEAYANMFTALCQELNIPVSYCYSNELQHIWNVVEIDGHWYHMDTTWNDSFTDRYEFALISTEKLKLAIESLFPGKPYQMYTPKTANSTKYDNAFWGQDVYGSMIPWSDYVYYIKDFQLYRGNVKNLYTEVILSLDDTKWQVEGGYYSCGFNDLIMIGNYIYYNTPNKIIKVSLADKQSTIVYNNSGTSLVSIIATSDGIKIGRNSNMNEDNINYEKVNINNVFKVQYFVGSSLYSVQYYNKGDSLNVPYNVQAPGYKFISWDVENGTTIVQNLTVMAEVSNLDEFFSVKFMVDGAVYTELLLNFGDTIVAPETPNKVPDELFLYQFVEWEGFVLGMTVSDNITFNAKFKEIGREYTIKFYNGINKIEELVLPAGSDVVYPSVEQEFTKNGKTYEFKGWTEAISTATKDAIVYTIYAEKDATFTVTYYVNGEVYFQESVSAGTLLTYISGKPIIENGTFEKWNGPAVNTPILKDIVIVAEFTSNNTNNNSNPLPIKNNTGLILIGATGVALIAVLVIYFVQPFKKKDN
jgi:hypothetical protein